MVAQNWLWHEWFWIWFVVLFDAEQRTKPTDGNKCKKCLMLNLYSSQGRQERERERLMTTNWQPREREHDMKCLLVSNQKSLTFLIAINHYQYYLPSIASQVEKHHYQSWLAITIDISRLLQSPSLTIRKCDSQIMFQLTIISKHHHH